MVGSAGWGGASLFKHSAEPPRLERQRGEEKKHRPTRGRASGRWVSPIRKKNKKTRQRGGRVALLHLDNARALGTAARRPTLLQRSFSGGSARQSLSYSWHTRALSQHFLAVGRLTRRGPPTLSAIDWWGTDCVRVCCGGQADGGGLQQAAQVRRQTGHMSGP